MKRLISKNYLVSGPSAVPSVLSAPHLQSSETSTFGQLQNRLDEAVQTNLRHARVGRSSSSRVISLTNHPTRYEFLPLSSMIASIYDPDASQLELIKQYFDIPAVCPHAFFVTVTFRTQHDSSVWSIEMANERKQLMKQFVEKVERIRDDHKRMAHFWLDYIDPRSERPRFSSATVASSQLAPTGLIELRPGLRLDANQCCKFVRHVQFGSHIFVASLACYHPEGVEAVKKLLETFDS